MSTRDPKSPPPDPVFENLEWVRQLCHRLVRDAAGADDLVQEVWLAALRNERNGLGRVRSVRGWLAGIAGNLAASERRGDARRATREQRSERRSDAPATDELVMRSEQMTQVARLVSELEEPYRRAMLLRWFEGRSVAEIAALEGIAGSTVGTRLHRGRAALRAKLERDGERRYGWAMALIPGAAMEEVRASAVSFSAAKAALWAGAVLLGVGAGARLAFPPGDGPITTFEVPGQGRLEGIRGAVAQGAGGAGSAGAPALGVGVARAEREALPPLRSPGSAAADVLEILVVDAEGRAAPGVPVYLADRDVPTISAASIGRTDAEGRAQLAWARVTMVGGKGQLVVARIAGREPPRASVPDEPSVDPVRIVLPPTGRVALEAAAPGGGLLVGRHWAALQAVFVGEGIRPRVSVETEGGAAEFPYVVLGESFSAGIGGSGSLHIDGPVVAGELVRVRVEPGPALAALVGRAVNGSGAPLAGRNLSFQALGSGSLGLSAQTDDAGRFVLLGEPLEVASRFRARTVGAHGEPGLRAEVSLPAGAVPGGRVALGDLVMAAPPTWVSGTVLGPDGLPLKGAMVSVSARWYGAESGVTADDGGFALPRPWEFEDAAEGVQPLEPTLEVRSHGLETFECALGLEGLRGTEVQLTRRRRIELTLAGVPDWMETPLQLFTVEAGAALDIERSLQRRSRSDVFEGYASLTDTAVRVHAGRYSGLSVAEILIPDASTEPIQWTVDLGPLVRRVTIEFDEDGPWEGRSWGLRFSQVSDALTGYESKEASSRELVLGLPLGAVEVVWKDRRGEDAHTVIPPGASRIRIE